MTIWDRITGPFHHVVEGAKGLFGHDQEAAQAAVFTAAIVALSAKMAKADGVVTTEEVTAFRRICEVQDGDLDRVRRLFDLAKHTTMGFEGYARQVANLYAARPETLEHVLDALFSIATSDGWVHERELHYLETVAGLLGFEAADFARIRARHVRVDSDPYTVLGVDRDADDAEIKRRYRALAMEHHPDRLVSRGLPPPYLKLANDRLAALNAAYAAVARERGL